ncbi:MAG: MotA/TolQ/ExbB proton channel family protein [Planctomycetota bacterium]|nr:MotA/TolQ/ExbB proton channel family protein [Planctomycetota bacterium]MDA1106068.1 MotA/TolQ/ExbB proton channel family protein [Planctomycetota bacterium]
MDASVLMDTIMRGGPVMWPLLVLSVLALAMLLERAYFWARIDSPSARRRFDGLIDAARKGDADLSRGLAATDAGPYGYLANRLLDLGADDATAIASTETARAPMERGLAMLSFIVTAAPLLGILGTVLGIISSFELLGDTTGLRDPREVSGGIAEALVSTAAGLVVSLFALLPLMLFRARCDRGLSRLEAVIAAVRAGFGTSAAAGASSR